MEIYEFLHWLIAVLPIRKPNASLQSHYVFSPYSLSRTISRLDYANSPNLCAGFDFKLFQLAISPVQQDPREHPLQGRIQKCKQMAPSGGVGAHPEGTRGVEGCTYGFTKKSGATNQTNLLNGTNWPNPVGNWWPAEHFPIQLQV